MSQRWKTKAGPAMQGIFIPIGALLLSAFFFILYGPIGMAVALLFVFLLFAMMSLYFYYRTRNVSYLAAFLFQFLIAAYLAILPYSIVPYSDIRVAWFFYFCGLSMLAWLVYLAITKKAKWKGREIFELAAEGVSRSGHGYTERPRPVGQVECNRSELLGFADFLKRHLVALSYADDFSVFFVPVRMGQEYGFLLGMTGHYYQKSWISFDREGSVTVKISKDDYYLYAEELEFDQLCETMGKLFVEFFEDYKRGEEARILSRLDGVGMNYFS